MRKFLRRWLGVEHLDDACRGLVHPRSLIALDERLTAVEHAVTRMDAMDRLIAEEKKVAPLPPMATGQRFVIRKKEETNG